MQTQEQPSAPYPGFYPPNQGMPFQQQAGMPPPPGMMPPPPGMMPPPQPGIMPPQPGMPPQPAAMAPYPPYGYGAANPSQPMLGKQDGTYQYSSGPAQPPPYSGPGTSATAGLVVLKPDEDPNFAPLGGSSGENGNPNSMALSFSEKSIRLGFIRKVYSILSLQLLLTAGIIILFTYVPAMRYFVRGNVAVWLISFFVAFAIMITVIIVLTCWQQGARTFPYNMIGLGVFTLAMGWMLGTTTSFFDTNVVAWAMVACVVVFIGLTIFAFQPWVDFTTVTALLAVSCISLLFFIVWIFVPVFRGTTPWVYILYGFIGVILFSAYLVIDTQLMMGGKHTYMISPEDYIFACIQLYLDVVQIFLMILMILGAGSRS